MCVTKDERDPYEKFFWAQYLARLLCLIDVLRSLEASCEVSFLLESGVCGLSHLLFLSERRDRMKYEEVYASG